MNKLLALIILSFMLAACGFVEKSAPMYAAPDQPAETAQPVVPPSLPQSSQDLDAIKQKISDHRKEIEERHTIKITLMGLGKDHMLMEIRRTGSVEQMLSEAEVEAVKQTLYEFAGTEFPLKLGVRTCCTGQPDIAGTIKSVNKDQILVVDDQKKVGDTENPEAYWVGLQADGILLVDGTAISTGFDKPLIGRTVKGWSTGFKMQSYPGHMSALKIVVE